MATYETYIPTTTRTYDPRTTSPTRTYSPTPAPTGTGSITGIKVEEGPLGPNPGTWDPAPPPLPGVITPNPAAPPAEEEKEELDTRELEAFFKDFLRRYGLPESLWLKIKEWIISGAGREEILFNLRSTAEYQAAFPEYFARIKAGHKALSEDEILSLRDTYKQIARFYGFTPGTQDVTNAIVNDISSSEMNQRFGLYKQMEESSPWLRQVLEQESGEGITDDDIFDFLNPKIQTPKLDRFFRNAVTRQRALFNEGGGGDPRLQLMNPEERRRLQAS